MTDDVALTKLIYDATGARQGAAEFRAASQSIIADNDRVLAALARSEATLVAGQGKKSTAFRTTSDAAAQSAKAEVKAASDAADAVDKSRDRMLAAMAARRQAFAREAQRGDPFSSRLGNVSLGEVRGAQSGMAAVPVAQIARNFEARVAALEAGMRRPASSASAAMGPAAAVTPASIGPLVSSAFGSIRAGDPAVARGVRNVTLAEASDPVATSALSRIHNAAAASGAASGLVSTPGMVGAATTGLGCDCHALTEAIARLSLSVDKLQAQLVAAPAAARQAAAATARPLPAAGSADRRAETAPGYDTPWLVEPIVPRGAATARREMLRQQALEERAAYGATTAQQPYFVSGAALRSLGTGIINTNRASGEDDRAARIAAARDAATRAPIPALLPAVATTAAQGDIGIWTRARQGIESFGTSLKNLFSGTQSAEADLHGVASATEHLGSASTHATGGIHLLGEAHHTARGSIRELGEAVRISGSAAEGAASPYELLRFGVIGLAREFGAPGIGVALAGGALFAGITLLAKRAQETEANLLSFGATLKATGGAGGASAEGLQHLVERLKQTGISAEEAKKTVDSVTHTAGIAPGTYDQIALLGRNTAAVFGGDAAARAGEWAKAVAGGVGPVIKLASELNLNLSPGEIDAAVAADRLGASQQALAGLLDASARQIGNARDTFTGLKNSFQDLKNAWDSLLESLSKSPRVTGVTEAAAAALKAAATPTGQNITLGVAGGAVAGVLGGVAAKSLGIPLSISRGALLGAGTGAVIGGAGEQGFGGAITQIGTGALVGASIPGPPQVKAGAAAVGAGLAALPLVYGSGGPLGTPAATIAETQAPQWAVQSSAEFGITIDKQIDATNKNTAALDKLTTATAAEGGARAAEGGASAELPPPLARTPSEASTRSTEDRLGYSPGEVVPARLLDALIQVESHGEVGAVNPKFPKPGEEQALGVGQIKLSTARGLSGAEDTTHEQLLTDAGLNRQLSSRYLAQQITHFGSVRLGLEAYNAGPRAVEQFRTGAGPEPSAGYAAKVLAAAGGAYTGQETPGQLALSTSPITKPTGEQAAALKDLTENDREHLRILQSTEGFSRQFQLGYQNIVNEERNVTDEALRHQRITEKTSTLINELSQQYTDQARDAGRTAEQTERIRNAYRDAGVAAGQATEAQVEAENKLRLQGGPGADPYRRQILEQQAQDALRAGYQQVAATEPVIAAQRELAAATLRGRQAQDEAKIAIEAHAFAQEALYRAQNLGVHATLAEAEALEQRKAAQLGVAAAIEHTRELGERTQPLQLANRATGFEIGLQAQGLGSDQIRAQTEVFRAQQEIALQHRPTADPEAAALQQKAEEAYLGEVAAGAQLNVEMAETLRQSARLNEAFTSIASTIDGELSNSIRNALIRTPLEANQHLKHYWDDFRAGLKQVAGEILSTFAQIALIKPLTGTIAGALGLGQTAQQLGTFGGLFTGAGGNRQGSASPISGSQLALNVSGLSNGGSIFGATQGGSVFASGNVLSLQTAGQALAGAATGPVAAAPTADQSQPAQAIPAPLSEGAAAPILETFLGTITSAAADGTQQSLAAAATTAGAPTTFIIPGTSTPITGESSLAPALPAPVEAALPTGVPAQPTPGAATPAVPGSPLNLGNAAAVASLGGSLVNSGALNGLLPNWLSSTSGSGGIFGNAIGGLTGAINRLGASTGLFAGSAGTTGANALSAADLADLGVPTSTGLFGTSATLSATLGGAAAGFGAGTLLNSVLGGNQVTGTIGSGAGSLLGALVGAIAGPVGTLLGGIVGGAGGGALGGLIGPGPAGQSAGVTIGAGGAQTFEQAGGSAANIQASNQVAGQISSFVQQLGQLTDAQGKSIGTINSGLIAVQSNNRNGISVTGGNISGGNFGQNAANAVTQTELQIINSLTNVGSTLKTVLGHITDPGQLQAAVQFVDVYDKLNVTSAQLTASLTGNVDAVGPFSQALTQINSTFAQLTAQATQFGVDASPIAAALDTVTQTLHQDFAISVAEALSTAIDGGNDFLGSLIKIHQSYVQATTDAKALASATDAAGASQAQAAAAAATPTVSSSAVSSDTGSQLTGDAAAAWSAFQALAKKSGFADGGTTPPGWIMVGERGPEWMLQSGGATVLPHGKQPAQAPDHLGRSFAQGTIGATDVAGQLPGIGSAISEASGGPSLLGAAGGAAGISSDTLSAIGDVLPIAGPIAGGLLSLATGGNPVSSAFGTAASLIGFALGGPIGGAIGGLVGLVGNLFGPKPSNRASGDLVDLSSGDVTGFQSSGNSKADQTVQEISLGISRITMAFQQATGGSISGAVSVQDGSRDGIKTSYSGPLGQIDMKWGDVSSAIGQFGLAIAHDLRGVDPALQAQLSNISDPNALIPAIENFTGKGIDLSSANPVSSPAAAAAPQPVAAAVPSAPAQPAAAPAAAAMAPAAPTDIGSVVATLDSGSALTTSQAASLAMYQSETGQSLDQVQAALDVGAIAPIAAPATAAPTDIPSIIATIGSGAAVSADQAAALATYQSETGQSLDQIQAEVAAGGTSFAFAAGTSSTPPGWILVGERGPEWMHQPGGATVLPNGVQPPDAVSAAGRSFATGTTDALTTAIAGTEQAQAGPILAALGIDQLTTAIQQLTTVAPEIATMAQNLIASGNALPDILTQGIQALTDPLGIAIEKEKALGAERVAVATQVGEDLVKVQELNSANLVQAVISNLSNQTALTAVQYPGNTRALETIQAAPTLAQLSGQQLTALISDISTVAPDLAALGQQLIDTGTALPDTITQALEGIVNPLKLSIQQQAAQAEARNQIQAVTGQDPAAVAALNTASITQAVTAALGNSTALLALAAHGSPAGLTALQAGPAIAAIGADQLQALLSAIGTAAPQLTDMIHALITSGTALPDALIQATQAINEAGVLAVEKAQALAFEQVQAAGPAGQNIGEAQALGRAEISQATAQATGTQIPFGPLPDWVTQLEEAVSAPLQLAIQKEQAAGLQRVQIAEVTGTDLVRVQKENADAVAQIWYQATQQLTSLKNDLTSGSLSGLTAATQVTAALSQFNTILGLVQGGNTSFINELATAGQAAVQASTTAYGQGPQTASVREQVFQAISPFLVSATGYPNTNLAAVAAGDTAMTGPSGAPTDLQANTSALQDLTAAITGATPAAGGKNQGVGNNLISTPLNAAGTSGVGAAVPNLTANPVTGQSFAGSGITAVTPNFPTFPSASTLSNALSDAIAGPASAGDYTAINQAVQAGILNAASQPQYSAAITAAAQYAAGQTVSPSAPLAQALSDALNGTPTLTEWATIIAAVNAGLINPVSDPQYATVIQRARIVANAQATSLSQVPNTQTAFATTFFGRPAFASGSASTPAGMILVGERGPEWMRGANDNHWSQVGTAGPQMIDQPGGATILPFPKMPPARSFAGGTMLPAPSFDLPASGSSDSALAPGNERLLRALLMQVQAGNKQAMDDAQTGHEIARGIRSGIGPGISAPARRAVG